MQKILHNRTPYIGALLILVAFMLSAFIPAIKAQAAQITPKAKTWSALQDAINDAESDDTIILNADVTAGKTDTVLTVPDGSVLTLDLNGHTIDRALAEPGGNAGSAIHVQSGAMLTVTDSSEDATGKITGGYAPHGGGINNSGTLIVEGGCITGNAASDSGGGVVNNGNLIVKSGKITENKALTEAGGVFNADKGYMTIDKSVVFGNSAAKKADIKNAGSMKAIGGETEDLIAVRVVLDLATVLPPLVLLIVLFIAVRLDNYLSREQKRVMYTIAALVVILVIQNCLDNWLYQTGNWITLRTVVSIIGYALRPAILAMFLHIIRPGRSYKLVWAAVGANAALYMTALFSPLTFSFSSYGHFLSGPLNPVCLILSGVLFLYCIYTTIRVFHPKERKETWIPVLALVIISLSVVLDYAVEYDEQSVSFLTIAITISCMMYYIWIHLQFVREHERALQAEHRIQIMMTQIQPHFLFNTLNSVMALCNKDPKAAMRTLGLFSVYLRDNLESLENTELILLSKELEHTRVYTEIEMIRFPNIRIEYDIQDEDFSVPALTVQPLVENAIRHGARSRADGVVRIGTRCEGNDHLIIIEDNGPGFEEKQAECADSTHIGISNVRERLEKMCGGTMTIDANPGEGTTIVLRIPDSEEMKKNENRMRR